MTVNDNTPVLVGCAQATKKLPPAEAMTPLQMLLEVSRMAAADAGITEAQLQQIDTIANTRLIIDSTDFGGFGCGRYNNLPHSIACGLGANIRQGFYAAAGGNTPQMLVNQMASRIAAGDSDITLIAGSENMATLMGAIKTGVQLDWNDDSGAEPDTLGDTRSGTSAHENDYGLFYPINTYPLFENAIRGQHQRDIDSQMQFIGELFSPMTRVAAANPHAWFPIERSAAEIATPTPKNRFISYPYTKYMNAVIQVDMAAALLMMSAGTARKMGITEDRWVYLNGCADTHDHWHLSERINYHSSPAIQRMGHEALTMAQQTIDDMDFFDIYSCFPSAVQIACQELGIATNDQRGLTVTGGLPYFGGPGNNYALHSIATMIEQVRSQPGSSGLVTANGWHITKHAVGIYSTEPRNAQWQRKDPNSYQAELDQMDKPAFTETPSGKARVETYTITHNPAGPIQGIIIGRLEDNTRFLANTPADPSLLEDLKQTEVLNLEGQVKHENGKNIFMPE